MNRLIALGAGMAWLAAAGCRGPYDPVAPRKSHPDGQHQQRSGISMLTRNVRDSMILVQGPDATRAPGGQIQIRTVMQNRFSEGDLWADIQYVYFDANQFPIEKSEWMPTRFPARELVALEGNSLRGDAQSFNIQFKNLRYPGGQRPRSPGWVFEWGIFFDSILPK